MAFEPFRVALFWGVISAVSLPLGAWLGLVARPGRKVTSALMAFGGGALLFALTIELFAKSLEHARERGDAVVLATVAGAVAGGLLFDVLNLVLNDRGAFLRKLNLTRDHLSRLRIVTARRVIGRLSRVRLLRSLPPSSIARLARRMTRRRVAPGEIVFREGDEGTHLYFVASGEIEILHERDGGERIIAVLGENETFGEMALLSGTRRNATARARTGTELLEVSQSDFDALLAGSQALREAVGKLFHERAEDLSRKAPGYEAEVWEEEALSHLERLNVELSEEEIEEESRRVAATGGVALAIWLGILLDGIPESLIIGMLTTGAGGISLAFVVGVFLANLPEAMSGSVAMRRSGMGSRRILWMWTSLCVMTGLGAVLGVLLFPPHPTGAVFYLVAGIEGLAAGAMLTVIAETILPEAAEHGGAIVGLTTLSGFLVALLVKIV